METELRRLTHLNLYDIFINKQLGMEDNDEIDAMVEQHGGFSDLLLLIFENDRTNDQRLDTY